RPGQQPHKQTVNNLRTTPGFVVAFRLVSAGKLVLEVVVANLKDRQNVLVLWWLFGLLVRENQH
ncbi:hypothetical protein, partial [Actinomyces bouchesdurhonensis]|uniref:hypothetical protein n=1 Tax=Actinomyces bouchesdurhonensis TaxID=1852361 RepID=UPI003C76EC55